MTTKNHHPDNERMKRKYFEYLQEADGYSVASVDGVAAALHRFEVYTGFRDFKAFRPEQAKGFKHALAKQRNASTGKGLSKATLHSTARYLRAFFRWLAEQPGYRSKLQASDASYFNLTANDVRIATAERERPVPTLDQIARVLDGMPTATAIEKRNRALIAFAILTGARDGALASFRIRHIDLADRSVLQDAREVKTKARKTFRTWFFPVGDAPFRILSEWFDYLKTELLFGPSEPLFPRTLVAQGPDRVFAPAGLARECWSSADPIRAVFRDSFERVGLPYCNPHAFRKTLAQLGMQVCRNAEELKAWSQNLGHEGVLTTFTSYGSIAQSRQAELIRALATSQPTAEVSRFAQEVADLARRRGLSG